MEKASEKDNILMFAVGNPGEDYEKQITEFWKEKMDPMPEEKWRKLIALYRPRIETYGALRDQAAYFFKEAEYSDAQTLGEVRANAAVLEVLKAWHEAMSELPDFGDTALMDQKTRQIAEGAGLRPKDIIHPLRFILTGRTATPGIFELISLLGRETCLARLKKFLA